MADHAASQLALLRRNDPRETFVNIHLSDSTDDDELSEAFQANNHVNCINLYLYRGSWIGTDNYWASLLRVIATRGNQKQLNLHDDIDSEDRISPEQIAPFLLAMQQNPKVQTVQLSRLRLSGDSMASFLDNATSVTTLDIYDCGMEAPGGALAIAAALQRNTNIQRLELCHLDEWTAFQF
jgi:hypothetical protein